MIRHKLRVIIFLIENKGYTIERFIHGMEAEYNDITSWNFTDIPQALGASEGDVGIHVVKTKGELEDLLQDESFSAARSLQVSHSYKSTESKANLTFEFVEMHMPQHDAPKLLKDVATGAANNNAQ